MTFRDAHIHALQVLESALDLPRDEAHTRARLLLDFAAKQRYAHLMSPAQVLDVGQQQVLEAALERAARGEPLPYIIGEQEFCGRAFHVNTSTLIPRPETELLVEATSKYLRKQNLSQVLEAADLGTGSGAIAVSVALENPHLRVLATDISASALEVARANARRHGVEERVELALSDANWVAPLVGRTFDAIVSNPPYIAREEIEHLQIEVRQFEPRAALDGGEDGLDVYRLFARALPKYLRADGFVALELGAEQWDEVAHLFRENGWSVEPPILDGQQIQRVLIALRL